MISYLGRINYAFDNKYLVTAAFRSDGSSRFGANNKWGSFPSLSVGWRIKQESFMQNIDLINDLKLRASYGISGNNRIGNYSGIGLLNIGYYPTGDALKNTVNPGTMPNDNLGWEKTRQINIGLDLGLFKNRVHFEADIYSSKSLELLLNVPVPTITGYSTQMQNVGKVQNRGMELLLSTKNLVNKFQWSSDFNISFNKNKVLELGPGGQPIFASAPNAANAFITMVGKPIACFYGYVYDGVYMSVQELESNPHLSNDKVGDGRYIDVNKDKVLDANDKTILGNNHPVFTAGFNNNLSYKNFNLALQFTASYGAKIFSIYKRMIAVYHGDRNGMIEVLDRWRSAEEPGNGKIFRATRTPTGWSRDPSSLWVTDGSYLRLRNASLSYQFDDKTIQTINMKGLRVYITSQNLFTLTKNPGYDPETSSEGDGLTRGGDYTGYPAARSVILGFNVTF
ncbi:MAG TPA: SusC/RagA family TonB-linked outer membrane protein, partial [Bacteroidales bacterium]|nr:SusC/RagA family TonB-linked outer membrane protein [Bacteroidales bacterium]